MYKKKLNVENPLKTGNAALDYAAGQIKPVKAWNTGFNAGNMVLSPNKHTMKPVNAKSRTSQNTGEQI